jgi:hypothetical protein
MPPAIRFHLKFVLNHENISSVVKSFHKKTCAVPLITPSSSLLLHDIVTKDSTFHRTTELRDGRYSDVCYVVRKPCAIEPGVPF